jgi:SAM-dependent methyltransferase
MLGTLTERVRDFASAPWRTDLEAYWDQLADEDPIYYCSGRLQFLGSRDYGASFEVSTRDLRRVLEAPFASLRLAPAGERALVFGCGYGRQFPGLRELGFGEVLGVDISSRMVDLGRRVVPTGDVRFIHAGDLGPVDDGSIGFAFSRGVMPYWNSEQDVLDLLPQLYRVLRPGGAFCFHFGGRAPSFRLRLIRALPPPLRPEALLGPILVRLGIGRGRGKCWKCPEFLKRALFLPPGRVVAELSQLGFLALTVRPMARRRRLLERLATMEVEVRSTGSAREGPGEARS